MICDNLLKCPKKLEISLKEFFNQGRKKKVIAPWIGDFHRLISHWPRDLSGMYLISHNSQPFSFQKNANVQKRVK